MGEGIVITLENVRSLQQGESIVTRRRVVGSNSKIFYKLVEPLTFKLSNSDVIHIDAGFTWDLSSVPRFLWGLLPPDGDFEIASMIHDYLYINHKELGWYDRKFADKEMLAWSKAVSGTRSKVSVRNFDNQVRYIAVRLFGWYIWNKRK